MPIIRCSSDLPPLLNAKLATGSKQKGCPCHHSTDCKITMMVHCCWSLHDESELNDAVSFLCRLTVAEHIQIFSYGASPPEADGKNLNCCAVLWLWTLSNHGSLKMYA